jgi:hypothetical protein
MSLVHRRIENALLAEWEHAGRSDDGFLLTHSDVELDALLWDSHPARNSESLKLKAISFRAGVLQVITDPRVPEGEYYVARRV